MLTSHQTLLVGYNDINKFYTVNHFSVVFYELDGRLFTRLSAQIYNELSDYVDVAVEVSDLVYAIQIKKNLNNDVSR